MPAIDYSRFYRYDELMALLRGFAAEHPAHVAVESIGRSHEGRDSYIRNTITRAYREVLGREPDPGGYATYEKAMRERGYTERDVRAALMSGDEYRQKRGKK